MAEGRLRRIRARAHASLHASVERMVRFPARVAPAASPVARPARDAAPWRDQAGGRRRRQRMPASGEIALRRSGGFAFQVQLGDVSPGGCKVELVELVDLSDRVIARLPGLEPFGARVAWVDGHAAGLEFERAIYPPVFDLLLSRLG